MTLKSKVLASAAAMLLAGAIGTAAGISPASATQQQICDSESGYYCMNNWNGSNQYVKMYSGGVSHEDFVTRFNTTECGTGTVQSTMQGDSRNCPFTDKYLDDVTWNMPIVQIEYGPTGQCIGTTSAGTAWMGACAGNNGVGGGTGTTMIYDSLGQYYEGYIDRYWSDYYSSGEDYSQYGLQSGNCDGCYLYLNADMSAGFGTI